MYLMGLVPCVNLYPIPLLFNLSELKKKRIKQQLGCNMHRTKAYYQDTPGKNIRINRNFFTRYTLVYTTPAQAESIAQGYNAVPDRLVTDFLSIKLYL